MTDQMIAFPVGILDRLTIETAIFTPEDKELGIIVLSEVIESEHILRVYQLMLSTDEIQYNFVQELVAFTLNTREEADELIEMFPNISGLEMLFMLNPLRPFPDRKIGRASCREIVMIEVVSQ